MRQHEVRGRELRGLVVVLEGLVAVPLRVEGARQVVAALGAHGLVLRVVERVQGQVLDLAVILKHVQFNDNGISSAWGLKAFRFRFKGLNIALIELTMFSMHAYSCLKFGLPLYFFFAFIICFLFFFPFVNKIKRILNKSWKDRVVLNHVKGYIPF